MSPNLYGESKSRVSSFRANATVSIDAVIKNVKEAVNEKNFAVAVNLLPLEDHDTDAEASNFYHSHGITSAEADELLLKHGRNELVATTIPSWKIFVAGLWGPMPIILWVAIIIEWALETWIDGGILFFIIVANATISWYENFITLLYLLPLTLFTSLTHHPLRYETTKAGDAVAALKKSLKPEATVKRDGAWKRIDAAFVTLRLVDHFLALLF